MTESASGTDLFRQATAAPKLEPNMIEPCHPLPSPVQPLRGHQYVGRTRRGREMEKLENVNVKHMFLGEAGLEKSNGRLKSRKLETSQVV